MKAGLVIGDVSSMVCLRHSEQPASVEPRTQPLPVGVTTDSGMFATFILGGQKPRRMKLTT